MSTTLVELAESARINLVVNRGSDAAALIGIHQLQELTTFLHSNPVGQTIVPDDEESEVHEVQQVPSTAPSPLGDDALDPEVRNIVAGLASQIERLRLLLGYFPSGR